MRFDPKPVNVPARSYVIYAPTPWDGARQAAHFLAEALAQDHPVLYIDPPVSPLSPIRYGLGGDSWTQLRTVFDRRLRTHGRLRVFSPLVLPPIRNRRMYSLSLPALRAQIAHAVARAGMQDPIVIAWQALTELTGVAGEALRVGVVMDHPAAGASLMGLDPAESEAETAELCAAADLVCTTSRAVHGLLAERGCESELVPFGFSTNAADLFDAAVRPHEYESLPRPLLGYTGGIDDRLDYELVLRLADRFSEGSIVFVGPLSPRLSASARAALAARSNIHLLGPRSREQLPAYIRYLDVALMPYADILFTRYQAPIKLWEYLYAGPPIVGTGSVDLRSYPPPLVSFAENADDAPALVEAVLADPGTGRQERRRFALANTWHDRAMQLDALVDQQAAKATGKLDGELVAAACS
jgi:teichuronic acid biosynthesis glycosyltransferase TuaH